MSGHLSEPEGPLTNAEIIDLADAVAALGLDSDPIDGGEATRRLLAAELDESLRILEVIVQQAREATDGFEFAAALGNLQEVIKTVARRGRRRWAP